MDPRENMVLAVIGALTEAGYLLPEKVKAADIRRKIKHMATDLGSARAALRDVEEQLRPFSRTQSWTDEDGCPHQMITIKCLGCKRVVVKGQELVHADGCLWQFVKAHTSERK